LGDKTPEEAFSGKKPEVGHFRIFGCLTYSHVPSEKRTKLDPTTEKGIFVGYSKTSKAFRIYIPSLRKTIVRRDVRFEEDRAFRRSRDMEQGEQSSPQTQVSPSQSIVTQSSGPPASGTTGPQVTGSQVIGPQVTGSQGIVSQSTSSQTTSGSSSGTLVFRWWD
jgi:hypothetical protein